MPAVKTMNCLQLSFCYPSFKHHIRLPQICGISLKVSLLILFHKQCISHIPSKDVVDFRKYTHIPQYRALYHFLS